jgi:hypothetical protein
MCWCDKTGKREKYCDLFCQDEASAWVRTQVEKETQEKNARIRSVLQNARNILADSGYLYVKEIDKVLAL